MTTCSWVWVWVGLSMEMYLLFAQCATKLFWSLRHISTFTVQIHDSKINEFSSSLLESWNFIVFLLFGSFSRLFRQYLSPLEFQHLYFWWGNENSKFNIFLFSFCWFRSEQGWYYRWGQGKFWIITISMCLAIIPFRTPRTFRPLSICDI